MAPAIPTASLTLKYPAYSSTFDPENSDFLFVGGGGGESRSGIKNKITLIDTSKRREIAEVIDVELSASEDSVQNLAVAQSQEDSAVVYAGINSSSADQEKGLNEHLRSFRLRYPARRSRNRDTSSDLATAQKTSTPTIEALSKASLFTSPDAKVKETYQRIMRLGQPTAEQPKLGVIATGLAPEGEVIVFEATNPRPDKRDIRQRINLGKAKEAADVDIISLDMSTYRVAYCCDHEVFLSTVPSTKASAPQEPVLIYSTPLPSPAGSPRLKFRFLRFLTPKLLIGVLNLPKASGADLFLLEVNGKGTEATALLRKTLPKRLKAASTFAVSLLPSPKAGGDIQHVFAIGSQDHSITILTLDHNPNEARNLRFREHSTQREVHPLQILSLAFSAFTPPEDPIKATPQYLKLASTGLSNTVVVYTLPLIPYPSPVAKRKPTDPPVRYTLIPPGPVKGQTPLGLSVIIAVVLVAISAFLLQTVIEIRGVTPEILGAKDWLSDSLREKIALPWMFDEQPIITDSLPPLESGARKAYEVVKDSIPEDLEDVKSASKSATRKVGEAAKKVKKTVIRQHEGLRDVLSQRAEHLATQLTSDEDDEEEADDEDHSYPEDHPLSKVIVLSDLSSDDEHTVAGELHHSEADILEQGTARKWDDLEDHEKKGWLRKLEDAGIWAAEEGETVLKGIFFGELGGVIAGAIRG